MRSTHVLGIPNVIRISASGAHFYFKTQNSPRGNRIRIVIRSQTKTRQKNQSKKTTTPFGEFDSIKIQQLPWRRLFYTNIEILGTKRMSPSATNSLSKVERTLAIPLEREHKLSVRNRLLLFMLCDISNILHAFCHV